MNFHFLSHRFFEYISLFPPLEHRTMGFRLLAFLRLPLLTVRWKYRFSVVFPSTSTPFPARHLRVLFCHRQEHEKRSKKKKKKKLDGHFMSSVFSLATRSCSRNPPEYVPEQNFREYETRLQFPISATARLLDDDTRHKYDEAQKNGD